MRDSRAFAGCVAGLVLLIGASASAQTLTRGPFIQNPDALTTTMTILWWTNVAGDSTVEYGTTLALGSTKNVAQAGSCEIGAAGTCHTVQLTGLTPGTKYFYQLKTNGGTVLAASSSVYFHTFRTPVDPADLHFTVVGDWGSGSSATTNVANNQTAADPPLIVTTGDNAYENGTLSDWDNNALVAAYENGILRRAVFMPALGNHDLNDVGASNWADSVEIKMFALPRNAPVGQEERYFSFDHGDAHFIVLDSNPPAVNATQTNWLEADLAATSRKWIFVFLHHTPYSCATGFAALGSSLNVRSTWGPLFEEYGVDIVFDGHDHSYERSIAVDDFSVGGGAGPDGKTTYYIMTGGGGKTLDGDADVDDGGANASGLLRSSEDCYWLEDGCPGGPTNPSPPPALGPYCSFSRFHHTDVRIVGNDTLTVRAIDQNNVQFDQFVIVKDSNCGDGVVEGAEQCDDTNPCCDLPTCTFKASGTTCRSAAGVCDAVETCTGSASACPVNAFLPSSSVCRSAAGACDVAENCTGSGAACPGNTLAASGTVCRSAAGLCDQTEVCTGGSAACPSDVKLSSGTICAPVAGDCDVAETCDGISNACPANVFLGPGTTCRSANGACDAAESCTGSSPSCPADGLAASGVVCRPASGGCDVAETCTGASATCPGDGVAPSGATCRLSAGVCDPTESCNGSSPVCPPDALLPSTSVCRSAVGTCDIAEHCTGSSPACPSNALAPSSTVCRSAAGGCDVAENCTGSSSSCPSNGFAASGTVCRSAAGGCDLAEICSGSSAACPADGFVPSGAVCRSSAGICDVAESCSGSAAACPPNAFAPSSTVCRSSTGACDLAETCTGSSASCPADTSPSTSTVCRPAAGDCDLAETCTGSGTCPADAVKPSGTVCRTAAGVCDQAESCDGVSAACPSDAFAASGTVCRFAAGLCDVAESCDGTTAQCPADTGQLDGDGDGVCDVTDDCPDDPDPSQTDGDGDDLGDACDPCNNTIPVFATKAKLTIQKLATPPGDDKFKFTGYIQVPETPTIDPLNNNGVRVLIHDSAGGLVLDASVPPGAYSIANRVGWKVNGSGTAFTYKNAGIPVPLVQGIYKAQVKRSTKVVGLVKFTIAGKTGSYPVATANLPLVGTFVIDAPYATTNQCGEAVFPGPLNVCTYTAASGLLKCK